MRLGLIGYGYWGPNLGRVLFGLPETELAYVCDGSAERLDLARRNLPAVETTTDAERLLADDNLDAVVVATPAQTHHQLARAALERGKHVLVEKPLALTVEHAEELVGIADRHRRVLMVGHTFEHNPAVWKMAELIRDGELGDVYNVVSTRVNLGRVQRDLNAMWSIAPHDVSIFLYLLGEMPSKVSALGRRCLSKEVEDVVFVDLQFPSGVLGHIHVSWLEPSKVRRMSVVGSKKMVVYDDLESEGKIRIYDKRVLRVDDEEIFGEFHYRLHTGDVLIPRLDTSEPLANECGAFVEAVRNGGATVSDGRSGLRVVRVLEAAERSLRSDGAVIEV